MNDPGISFQYIFCDEELVVSTPHRRGWHGVLILPPLRFQKTHLLVIRGREDLFFLGVSRELTRENFLLYVGIRAYLRYLQSHTLIHHLSIQVLSFYLLALIIPAREQFNRVRVWKSCELTLIFRSLQVAPPGVLDVLVDHSGREVLSHGLFESRVGVFTR